jgi:hypothetical protein
MPLAATAQISQLCDRRRRSAQAEGMVTFVVVSGLATATLIMIATLARTL